VREVLAREKYFSQRPKPLERWLWQQGIAYAAERVFWVHWEEGARRGDWCSELSLKQVARECFVDISTVTRAYQVLKELGLISREDPGRDPKDPFRQAIAITEVFAPRELKQNLSRFPNRVRSAPARISTLEAPSPAQPTAAQHLGPDKAAVPTRAESKAVLEKLSAGERHEFYLASRDRRTAMTFDAKTALTPEERGRVLSILANLSGAAPRQGAMPERRVLPVAQYAKARKFSPLEVARVRKSVLQIAAAGAGNELFREVLWSMEEGALRRFDARLALNIALKKIREGAWTRPNRLPPHWLVGARAEACGGA
jgi:hypothetical protein